MSEEVKISEENQFSFENPEYRKTYWHTCSHVLAQAVKRLWPEVKLAIGPSIDNGFYYDMLAPFSFTPENLAEIEAEMRKICKEKLKKRKSRSRSSSSTTCPRTPSSASTSRASSPTSAPVRTSTPPAASRATASS